MKVASVGKAGLDRWPINRVARSPLLEHNLFGAFVRHILAHLQFRSSIDVLALDFTRQQREFSLLVPRQDIERVRIGA